MVNVDFDDLCQHDLKKRTYDKMSKNFVDLEIIDTYYVR